MYLIRSTKAYRKAHKRVTRHKDFDQKQLDQVIDALASGKKLDAKYRDHQLTGELKDYRECHIKNDILLVYQQHDNILILLLVDLGSHDSLFH
jgi:mRNA interferase YafQ